MKILLRKIELTEKHLKIILFLLMFLVILILFFVGTYSLTTSPRLCSSCHEMKPEYYTWKASVHSKIKCVYCHSQSGRQKFFQNQITLLKEIYKHIRGEFIPPIVMTKEINDLVCKECHDLKSRSVTPSGDLIIPHEIHETKGIKCTKCHSGISHGSIAKRKITYPIDYDKWDQNMGKVLMEDNKFVRPKMETCINCHRIRKGPLNCKACHSSGLIPSNHKTDEFKNGGHGRLAKLKLMECDNCHNYMSEEKIERLVEKPKSQKYLEREKKVNSIVTVDYYAKSNSFCKNCHGKKPLSHRKVEFFRSHGKEVKINVNRCLICHDYNPTNPNAVTQVSCNSCHPSPHIDDDWQLSHPIKFTSKPEINIDCNSCHVLDVCLKCHPATKNSLTTFKK